MNALWILIFACTAAFFLVMQLAVAETGHGITGWMISAGMVGYFARRWYSEVQERITEVEDDDS